MTHQNELNIEILNELLKNILKRMHWKDTVADTLGKNFKILKSL